jgi:hypothetical protein
MKVQLMVTIEVDRAMWAAWAAVPDETFAVERAIQEHMRDHLGHSPGFRATEATVTVNGMSRQADGTR